MQGPSSRSLTMMPRFERWWRGRRHRWDLRRTRSLPRTSSCLAATEGHTLHRCGCGHAGDERSVAVGPPDCGRRKHPCHFFHGVSRGSHPGTGDEGRGGLLSEEPFDEADRRECVKRMLKPDDAADDRGRVTRVGQDELSDQQPEVGRPPSLRLNCFVSGCQRQDGTLAVIVVATRTTVGEPRPTSRREVIPMGPQRANRTNRARRSAVHQDDLMCAVRPI